MKIVLWLVEVWVAGMVIGWLLMAVFALIARGRDLQLKLRKSVSTPDRAPESGAPSRR